MLCTEISAKGEGKRKNNFDSFFSDYNSKILFLIWNNYGNRGEKIFWIFSNDKISFLTFRQNDSLQKSFELKRKESLQNYFHFIICLLIVLFL